MNIFLKITTKNKKYKKYKAHQTENLESDFEPLAFEDLFDFVTIFWFIL